MRVIVPFDTIKPKTRLSGVLSDSQRQSFARAMLRDTLDAIENANHDPTVLATDAVDVETSVVVDNRPLSTAVNNIVASSTTPIAVLMADLPLVNTNSINRLVSQPESVVLAPGIGGGTNALVVRDERFTVDYHKISFQDHLAIAREADLSVGRIDSYRLAVDIDRPTDLTELLIHGDGHAVDWLRNAGFSLSATDGRPELIRSRKPADQ